MRYHPKLSSILSLIILLAMMSLTRESILPVQAQSGIDFQRSNLQGITDLNYPTSLQFGPDGRLYVAQRLGTIFALTIARNGLGDYVATAQENINLIWQDIPNRTDDTGEIVTSFENLPMSRQVTGLYVTGTASNPVIYVSSSDPREGGGGLKGDFNLDTNSGVVSRLTWTGTQWEHLQLVRGLPRSETNHSVNGLVLDESYNILYLAIGSMTNMGAPSEYFTFIAEYAYSGAILSIDLNLIGDSTYDLPTLDDPTRDNLSDGSDPNDPFGGNDGLNQARLDPASPVQIHASGFRNSYDVLLTENERLYTIVNGPNHTWGGPPATQRHGYCDNTPNDEDSRPFDDGLHFITGHGYYGGHPSPVRANPDGIYGEGNEELSPVPYDLANPVECDYRIPGGNDGSLATWTTSTNGLAEYTASNFMGEMQGDLLTVSYDGTVSRIKLNEAGNALIDLTPEDSEDWGYSTLFSDFGVIPLDITTQADNDIFPGTIWVAVFISHTIAVFEPVDYLCTSEDAGCE